MNCYISNIKAPLPKGIDKDNTLFFPEQSMSTEELLHTSQPADFNVYTDSMFIVPLYKCETVFIWSTDHKKWVNPDFQTYGTSYNIILRKLFNAKLTIPQACYDSSKITNVMGYKLK